MIPWQLGGRSGLDGRRSSPERSPVPRSTVDHGTEFQSRAVEDWAYRRGVQLDFIRPGKPVKMPSLSRLTVDCEMQVERPPIHHDG